MHYVEFEEKLNQLNITKKAFSIYIDIDYSTIIKWKNKNKIPKYAEIVLKNLIYKQEICNELAKIKEIK